MAMVKSSMESPVENPNCWDFWMWTAGIGISYVRRSKLNSCGEVMASLHKAPYRDTQSQHPFHQLGRIAARRWRIQIQMKNRIFIPLAMVSPGKFKLLRDHQGWRRQHQLDTSRTHCRSSDLGGCPWLVLACLGVSCLCCLVSGALLSSPRLLCNLIPRHNESATSP